MAKAARQMSDHGLGQANQTVGDACSVHEIGGEQEERNRQQHEGVVGFEHLGEEHEGRQPIIDEEDGNAGETEREGHRNPQDDQEPKGRKQNERNVARAHSALGIS